MSNYEWPAFNEGQGVLASDDPIEEIQPPTAEELAAMIEQAQQQGYQEGLEQGRQEAKQEQSQWLQERQAEFEQALETLNQQLQEALDTEHQALLSSIQWMCRETCQSALLDTLDQPETLDTLINAMLGQLPKGAIHHVTLHPDQAHRIAGAHSDPELGPWGIRIDSDQMTLRYDPIEALHGQD